MDALMALTTDIEVNASGSMFLFRPLTDAGRQWIDSHVVSEPWQWHGGALAVDYRYAWELARLAVEDGLEVL